MDLGQPPSERRLGDGVRPMPAETREIAGPHCVVNHSIAVAFSSAKTARIEPGSPWDKRWCESFNSKLREEFLDGEIYHSLREAQIMIEGWHCHYYTKHPHLALGHRPPVWKSSSGPLGHPRHFAGHPKCGDQARHAIRLKSDYPIGACQRCPVMPPDINDTVHIAHMRVARRFIYDSNISIYRKLPLNNPHCAAPEPRRLWSAGDREPLTGVTYAGLAARRGAGCSTVRSS
ncbi:transposase [Rubellimicrobium roseum]|uniref:Transposase n=1 Tax=Rubellimicrobium roseum TaxID=687525 RepID=A0A5C4N6I6_9RHOB|nr:transposase [Rubellimicrobium roseum]